SPSDTVLRWLFPLGQTVSGDGLFPTAVGLHGYPPRATWSSRRLMPGYRHSSYWKSRAMVRNVAATLGAATARSTPVASIAEHMTPTYPLERHSIRSRSLGANK